MDILKNFNNTKRGFDEAEEANNLRREEHNRKFEQLKKNSEEQGNRVAQRFQVIRNK